VQTSGLTLLNAGAGKDAIHAEFINAHGGPILKDKAAQAESDSGNARRFVLDYAGDVRYVKTWGLWFIFDAESGGYRPDTTGAIVVLAMATAAQIYYETPLLDGADKQRQRSRHAILSQNERALRSMLSLASAQPEIAATEADFDTEPDLLCCPNGIVELSTGILLPPGERRLISKRAGAPYDPDARCPAFLDFLADITGGSSELFDFLQVAIGYTLTGRVREQCLFLAVGAGSNGKTTLYEVLLNLLGEYGCRTPAETLLISRVGSEGVPNDVARLVGARLVVATELEQGRRLAEAKVKELTGGDMLVGRFMRGEFFQFRPQFKLWLSGNHLPRIQGADGGIWRRIRLLPFNVVIPDCRKDLGLPEKLRNELPGILAWAVCGAVRWYAEGLRAPAEVVAASDGYRQSEDILGQFIAERCAVDVEGVESLKSLTNAFNAWAEVNGERKVSSRNLGARLDERGLSKRRGTGNVVVVPGIRLLLT